jgi:hypothetical protein
MTLGIAECRISPVINRLATIDHLRSSEHDLETDSMDEVAGCVVDNDEASRSNCHRTSCKVI